MPYRDPPEFYAPWPLFGKKISFQWDNIRKDTETLKVLSRSLNFDENITKYIDSAVAGYEYGEDGFHNRFRTFYDKDTNNWILQFNTGTEASPTWVNYVTVNSIGTVTFQGAFYTATLDVSAGGDLGPVPPTVTNVRHLIFHTDNFYITTNSLSQPVVNVKALGDIKGATNLPGGSGIFAQKSGENLEFKSLTGGGSIVITPLADTIGITSTAIGTITGIQSAGGTNTLSAGVSGNDVTVKGLTAGPGILLTSDAVSVTIESTATGGGGGFYGIGVVQSDDKQGYSGINVLSFEASNFYIKRNSTDPDKVQINFRPTAGTAGAGTITGGTSLGGTEPVFASNAAPTINFKGLTAGTGISLGSDANAITVTNTGPTLAQIGPGFYGITVGQSNNVNIHKNINVIKFNTNHFYVHQNAGNADEVGVSLRQSVTELLDELAALPETIDSRIGPGFYGITTVQSDGKHPYKNINVLSFEAANFYLTRNDTDPDKVQINLRPTAGTAGAGTITGGTSLGGTEPVYATTTSPTINFKGLTAGAGISLTSDANQINIIATGTSGSDPGFYGITAIQSDGKHGYKNLNVLSFEASNFYLTRNTTDPDKVQINLRPAAGAAGGGTVTGGSSLGGDQAIYDSTAGPTMSFKGVSAGTGISLSSSASAVTITNTGPTLAQIGPGFYGIGVIQSDNTRGYSGINTLSFEVANFYLKRSTTDLDKVQINLRPAPAATVVSGTALGGDQAVFAGLVVTALTFKGITAGTGISLSADANAVTVTNTGPTLDQIGPGFYGIGVIQSDNTRGYSGINTLSFEKANFYISRSATDRDKVQINLRPSAATGSGTITGGTSLGGDQPIYGTTTAPTINIKGITAGTGISLSADANAVTVTNTGPTLSQIGPGFYGIGVIQSNDIKGYSGINTLSFEAANFYLKRSTTDLDKVQINLRPAPAATVVSGTALGGDQAVFAGLVGTALTFKGITAGTGISLGSDASAITITNTGPTLAQIGPGFYGIGVIQSDNKQGYSGINTLSFEAANFYIKRNVTDPDKVQISLRPTAGTGSGTITAGTSLGGTEAVYGTTTAPTINFKGLTAGTGISLGSDANSITVTNTGPTLANIGPGFYGIGVVQSDNKQGYSGINTLSFEASAFYIKRNATDPDKVQIGFRPTQGTVGSGTITGGTSLGGTEAVYGTTTAPTINFKGLTAGTGITLSSDANAITINSTGGASDPGFYGITVMQSDGLQSARGVNTIKFLSDNFYLKQHPGDTDEVTVNFREKRYDILESISFQFDYPVLEHYFLDSYAFFPYTVEAVNLVTQSGQAQVGFYIRNPLEGYERNPGISIQGLDPYLVQANKFRDTQYSTGNNVVNIGQELILAVFYLNQNPKAIRGSVRIRRPNAV